MNDKAQGSQGAPSGGMGLGDIYYVLFRHKWMIIICSALGIIGAGALLGIKPPLYRSDAKIFIRYVVDRALIPPGSEEPTRMVNNQEASILNTETKILLSLDVARLAALAIGPERILAKAGGGTNIDQAAALIGKNIEIELPPNSSVISILFRHPDPVVAQEALRQLIFVYMKQHKQTHQTVELFGDFVVAEVDRLRSELAKTEQQLREAKSKAGVSSLEDSKKDYADKISRIREDIFNAQAQVAQHQATLAELPKLVSTNLSATNAEVELPWEKINQYKQACGQLELLSRREQELLLQFTENNSFVRDVRAQITETGNTKKRLEEEYPRLMSLGVTPRLALGQPLAASLDPITEAIQVHALEAKIKFLSGQLKEIQSQAAKADEWETTILELQRRKEMEEADLKYFSSSLEQSRIENALGVGKAPNIGVIQWPSPPVKAWSKSFVKKVKMVAVGGVLSGIGFAFLVALFLDRSVKRVGDVTGKLGLPLFISIPDFTRNGNRLREKGVALTRKDSPEVLDAGQSEGTGEGSTQAVMKPLANWDWEHPLRRFYEGLRDRLIVHFEIKNIGHKPKMVAITSCGKGVGVTSIAAGLAASLSETGDGNVLLVDMNAEQGASQPFYKGKPGCGLEDALKHETRQSALVQSHLYVATEPLAENQLPSLLPKRFTNLMPKFKTSEYDYIIFDMPPVSPTSITPRLARLMDMTLFVIESEKTSQDVAKQALELLADAKANVSAVLNKTHSYVPQKLHPDLLNEA